MIINKRGLRSVINANKSKSYLLRPIFKNFSITKLTIDNNFLHNIIKINPQTEKIKIELNLNNLFERNLQLNLTEGKNTPETSNENKSNPNDDSLDKLFSFEFSKADNKITVSNVIGENQEFNKNRNDLEINLPMYANLFLNIKKSNNVRINSDQTTNNNKKNKAESLFGAKENLNGFELSCEESKIDVRDSLVYSNISVNAKKSEVKFRSLYAFNLKPLNNFKLFEESFLRTNKIKSLEEDNLTNESDVLKGEVQTNQSKNISIIADDSLIEIEKVKNFDKLFLRTNENFNFELAKEHPNSIKIDYIEVRNFNIELLNPKDKLKMNLYHLFENSIFKMKNINFKNINIKLHPMLLFNLNVYNTNKGKFQKHLIFDNEGYSFCPTIIFEIDKEFPKNYLVGFELIKIPKYFRKFMYVIISMFLIKIIFLSDNSLENYKDIEANLNTLDNLPMQLSEYKFYQLAMKKKFDKLLENLDK